MSEQKETDYIYMLYKNNLIKEMEIAFETENPNSKATFTMDQNYKYIKIVVMDRKFKFIKSYYATQFDCLPDKQSIMDFDFKDYPKSNAGCLDDYVRRFYLRFLKNHFENYKTAYKIYIEKQADFDLGETASV